jgi:hypothetical protein
MLVIVNGPSCCNHLAVRTEILVEAQQSIHLFSALIKSDAAIPVDPILGMAFHGLGSHLSINMRNQRQVIGRYARQGCGMNVDMNEAVPRADPDSVKR